MVDSVTKQQLFSYVNLCIFGFAIPLPYVSPSTRRLLHWPAIGAALAALALLLLEGLEYPAAHLEEHLRLVGEVQVDRGGSAADAAGDGSNVRVDGGCFM